MTERPAVRRSPSWRLSSRIERPDAAVLAILLAGIAAVGWYFSAFWLAVAIAGQLAIGGLGTVWVIGPATARLGFARYAVPATTGIALTLLGRALVEGVGPFLVPAAAVLLWTALWLELDLERSSRGRLGLELILVGVVFAAAEGTATLVPRNAWPTALGLLLLIIAVPAMRLSEARGRFGARAVGESLLHLLAVAQVAAGVALLTIPGLVGAAVIALAFHAWSGAAEALEGEASVRSVVVEFGALAVLGVVVALLLQGA